MVQLLRFKNLQAAGIVRSWPQLRHMQKHYGFPLGILLGPNTRAWDIAEIDKWLANRPIDLRLSLWNVLKSRSALGKK